MKYLKTYLAIMAIAMLVIMLASCAVPQIVTNPDGTTSTNLVVDPGFTNALAGAKALNDASAPFNPWYPITAAILTAVGVVGGAVGNKMLTSHKGK